MEGETLQDALERKVHQETGVRLGTFEIGNQYFQKVPFYCQYKREFWQYDQMFVRINIDDDAHLFFDGYQKTPEEGRAFWQPLHQLDEIAFHYVHAMAFRALLCS